ncbi:MAG TPA: hypothetical protein VKU87_04270, partial [Thermomicrobiaceae bacterium]|nr:hypothetical protein [Thermomicrobiaceae bacterium]
ASNVGDTARDAGSSMSETIKQNPVPAALVAFGVGWLWMRRKSPSGGSRRDYRSGGRDYAPRYAYDYRSGSYDPYGPYGPAQRWDEPGRTERPSTGGIGQTASQLQDRAGQVAGQVQEQAGQMVSQTQEQVGQWSDQAQQQVSQWGGQAQDQFQQLRSRFDRLLQENPLAVAAVTLGLGAAVGLMVPETEQENQWLGDTRDQVVDKAQASAQDKLQQVQQVAQKAKESAQDTIQQEAKKQGLTS